jgi:multimeric flavodoxin WrbA
MKYLIMDGNPDPSNARWDGFLGTVRDRLRAKGAETDVRILRDMDIRYCTGCWSCWWATPGLCAHKDDMAALYPDLIRADVVVWASPLVMGNVSALVKKAQDRFIPLLHPYIELVNGESHHRRRYPKDIDMGLIIQAGRADTKEDVALVRHMHERLALNGRGRLVLFEEASYEAVGA